MKHEGGNAMGYMDSISIRTSTELTDAGILKLERIGIFEKWLLKEVGSPKCGDKCFDTPRDVGVDRRIMVVIMKLLSKY